MRVRESSQPSLPRRVPAAAPGRAAEAWCRIVAALLAFAPRLASARPSGSGPLIGFGESVLDFLCGPLAYVVGAIGICIAALSLIFGNRDGLVKAFYAIVGAALLIGARQVIDFIASAAS